MTNATGKLRNYRWHVSGHVWSYDEAPAGASELRPLLRSFYELYLTPIPTEPSDPELLDTKKAKIAEQGCAARVLIILALALALAVWPVLFIGV